MFVVRWFRTSGITHSRNVYVPVMMMMMFPPHSTHLKLHVTPQKPSADTQKHKSAPAKQKRKLAVMNRQEVKVTSRVPAATRLRP